MRNVLHEVFVFAHLRKLGRAQGGGWSSSVPQVHYLYCITQGLGIVSPEAADDQGNAVRLLGSGTIWKAELQYSFCGHS